MLHAPAQLCCVMDDDVCNLVHVRVTSLQGISPTAVPVAMQVALGLYIISKIGRMFTVVGWLYTGAWLKQLRGKCDAMCRN